MNRPFGNYLREHRRLAEKNLLDMARYLGCSVPYLSQIETGRRGPPNKETIRKMATFLGIAPEELLQEAERDREFVELGLLNISPKKAEVAYMLSRSWPSISDKEAEDIENILNEFLKKP